MFDRSRWWRWACLDPRSIAAFRIALGTVTVADALARTRDLAAMLAPDGIFPPQLVRESLGGVTAWSLAWLDDSLAWGGLLLALQGLAGAALACGWATWLAAPVAWTLVVSVIRRTAPACNAGDTLLACLLLWACFLPTATVWSIDRRAARPPGRPIDAAIACPGSAALVLQLAIVYASAGIAKCNADWLSGAAVGRVLSVHDHGTAIGSALSGFPWLTVPAAYAVVGFELAAAPLLLAWPTPLVRGTLAGGCILFHLLVWLATSVGLFAPVAIAAWLAVLPGCTWDRIARRQDVGDDRARANVAVCPSPATAWLVVPLVAVMLASAVVAHRPATRAVPAPLRMAIRLTFLEQDWRMFGAVPAQTQWVRARATRSDGVEIDLLRKGVPDGAGPPAGGYGSLPHHRWHKLCWDLHRPLQRRFAPSLAAVLARDWNRAHGPGDQVVAVEIRAGRLRDGTTAEWLLGSWPDRSASGRGNLDRFLGRVGGTTGAPADEPLDDSPAADR
ncbi:MAG: HTTM domain-containing protein [Planctomycetaceae bacterium]